MKKFKYTFSKLIIALFIVGMAIAVASIVSNVINMVNHYKGNYEFTGYDWFLLILIVALSVFFIVIAISCLISSNYVIKDKKIVLSWGFIKNVIDLNEIKEMKYYPQKNRLELIFTDDSFFVVSTLNSWAYEFIDLIKEQAPKITYSEDSLS